MLHFIESDILIMPRYVNQGLTFNEIAFLFSFAEQSFAITTKFHNICFDGQYIYLDLTLVPLIAHRNELLNYFAYKELMVRSFCFWEDTNPDFVFLVKYVVSDGLTCIYETTINSTGILHSALVNALTQCEEFFAFIAEVDGLDAAQRFKEEYVKRRLWNAKEITLT